MWTAKRRASFGSCFTCTQHPPPVIIQYNHKECDPDFTQKKDSFNADTLNMFLSGHVIQRLDNTLRGFGLTNCWHNFQLFSIPYQDE